MQATYCNKVNKKKKLTELYLQQAGKGYFQAYEKHHFQIKKTERLLKILNNLKFEPMEEIPRNLNDSLILRIGSLKPVNIYYHFGRN